MKHEDIKVGMRVVPFQKTAWNPRRESIEEYINNAIVGNELGKYGYLYVIGYDDVEGSWALNSSFCKFTGDYFNAEDFEPYIEPVRVEFEFFGEPHGEFIKGKTIPQEIIDKEKEIKALRAFKEYWGNLYGDGLQVANWHQNGNLEPFDNFYESALAMYDEIMEG